MAKAIPPSSMAPPTPPTTPPMVALVEELNPELLPPFWLPLSDVGLLECETATTVLLVMTCEVATPLVVVTIVVRILSVVLDSDVDGVMVAVLMALVTTAVAVGEPAALLWVRVVVAAATETSAVVLGPTTTVDDSTTTLPCDVSVLVSAITVVEELIEMDDVVPFEIS